VRTDKSSELSKKLSQVVAITLDENRHHFMFTTPDSTVPMWELMTVQFITDVLHVEPVAMELRGNWILRSNEKAVIDEWKRAKPDA